MSLDELDAAYWADIERTVARDGPPERLRLRRLRLGPKVDPAAWKAFLSEYLAAAGRVLAPYGEVRETIVQEFTSVEPDGSAETTRSECRVVRSGGFRALRSTYPRVENAVLAHPARSLRARRPSRAGPWHLWDDEETAPPDEYRAALSQADGRHPYNVRGLGLLELADDLGSRVDDSAIVVTRLERFTREGRHWVRIGLKDQKPGDQVRWRDHTLLLDADREFIDHEATSTFADGGRLETRYDYDEHGGVPVFRSLDCNCLYPGDRRTRNTIKVVDRRFGPTPEAEFTVERLLDGAAVRRAARRREANRRSSTFLDWYRAPLAIGVMSLAGSAALLGRFGSSRTRRLPESESGS